MTTSRIITGVEGERAKLRGVALRIIREVLEKPLFDKLKPRDVRRDWLAPPPLRAFQHMEPLGFGILDDSSWLFHPRDCKPDLVWPLNVGMITDRGGESGELVMQRCYTISAKQARGYAGRFGPFMVRMDTAQMECDQLMTVAGLYVWLGGSWTDAQTRTLWSGRHAEQAVPNREELFAQDREQPALATALALRQRYEWAISLGLESSPSIRFATDPTGIKDLFRIRDLPEGRDRRAALMTWVEDHWRRDRSDPEIEIYVRKHLRGATSFSWRGMDCQILPSQFDIEQRDRMLAEREAMKSAGASSRLRETKESE